VAFGPLAIRGLALRGDPAEEAQGISLVAPFLALTGMRQCTLGQDVRLLQATGPYLRLPQGETKARLIGRPPLVQSSAPPPA
jgi:hypothetical protein